MNKKRIFPLLFMVVICAPYFSGAEMYKWRDKNGTLNFTDSPMSVPEDHLSDLEVETKYSDKPSAEKETDVQSDSRSEPAAEHNIQLSRGSNDVPKQNAASHPKNNYRFEDVLEAAYFGDIETLRKIIGPRKDVYTPDVDLIRPNVIMGNALRGKQYEVVKLLVECGYPRAWDEVENTFRDKDFDLTALKIIINSSTDFRSKFGSVALFSSITAKKYELVRYLLEAGVNPNDKTQPSLNAALFIRDKEMISLLLGFKADPYMKFNGVSPAEMAVRLRSADMLALLDTQNRYAEKAAQFRERKPPQGLPFIGSWAFRPQSGGFGSVGITFNQDGTALVGTDIGMFPAIWEYAGKEIKISPLDAQGNLMSEMSFEGSIQNDILSLVQSTRGASEPAKKLRRLDMKQLQEDNDQNIHPRFFRIQKACISADGLFYLQVNNRHIKVPIQQLVQGARASTYGFDQAKENRLSWASFLREPIPEAILKKSKEVPFVDRFASPQYSKDWDKVGFDHSTLASTVKGYDYTLYRLDSSKSELIILADKSFSHGKNWLVLFIQRSKDR